MKNITDIIYNKINNIKRNGYEVSSITLGFVIYHSLTKCSTLALLTAYRPRGDKNLELSFSGIPVKIVYGRKNLIQVNRKRKKKKNFLDYLKNIPTI